MSRSYKKYECCTDNKGTDKKRIAWKTVRQWLKDHPEELLNGSDYKRIYESYDICDYIFTYSWEDYWRDCHKWHEEAVKRGWGGYLEELDEEKEYRYWYKTYKAK